MAARPAVLLAALHLEYANLLAPALLQHDASDRRAGDIRRADHHVVARLHDEHLVERHLGAGIRREAVDDDHCAFGDFFLAAARLNDRKHVTLPLRRPAAAHEPISVAYPRIWKPIRATYRRADCATYRRAD